MTQAINFPNTGSDSVQILSSVAVHPPTQLVRLVGQLLSYMASMYQLSCT